jgi:hypothetical protein
MTPRKHAELIKAWADGAEIEAQLPSGAWAVCHDPYWGENSVYRIKPEPKPNVVITRTIELSHLPAGELSNGMIAVGCWGRDNVKLVFDGETHKLKSVELL